MHFVLTVKWPLHRHVFLLPTSAKPPGNPMTCPSHHSHFAAGHRALKSSSERKQWPATTVQVPVCRSSLTKSFSELCSTWSLFQRFQSALTRTRNFSDQSELKTQWKSKTASHPPHKVSYWLVAQKKAIFLYGMETRTLNQQMLRAASIIKSELHLISVSF